MKFEEALSIINGKEKQGYMVSFEIKEGVLLKSDHFPDKHAGELLIPTEAEAWDLAKRFAKAHPNTHNVYVIDGSFSPVKEYDSKKLNRL